MNPADRRHLSLAFELAERGLGATSPNPAVGAVVVRDGAVVGRGYHARAGEDHAETIALREAAGLARGADLFLNLEPCCWHRLLEGRSPSCVEQILAAGIRRVVAATRDPNPAIDGRGLRMLAEAGVAIEPEDPYFARRAARLNEIFFKYVVTKRPFVVLKAGMTLDGRIALAGGASRWITGEQARAEARALRDRHDAVLVGIGTVLADDPLLLPGEGSRRPAPPVRVVLDSRLRLPTGSRLARSARPRPRDWSSARRRPMGRGPGRSRRAAWRWSGRGRDGPIRAPFSRSSGRASSPRCWWREEARCSAPSCGGGTPTRRTCSSPRA